MSDFDRSPVFLHALWRSCSTYFWSKFRENPDWRCYNEPFHEHLLILDTESIREISSVTGVLRHPEVDKHYFAEYDIKPEGGVRYFQKRFTAKNYYMRPGDRDDEFKMYVEGLLAFTAMNMQRPFFKPTRSVLRGEWLKSKVGGVHIYLNRDFGGVMNSYLSYDHLQSYYLRCCALIIGQNADNPFFTEMAEFKNLAPWAGDTYREEYDHFGAITDLWDLQDFSDVVGFLWVAGLAQASRYSDLLIDVANMNNDLYRRKTGAGILELTMTALDLSDFELPPLPEENFIISDDAIPIIRRAVEAQQPDWARLEKMGLADSTKKFIRRITD